MKINIYYGGRGIVDDPTLNIINTMQNVLEELNVSVERFNLYEIKNAITTLPQTLKSADGIILATTVEWYGIGGYMQSFLDACWLYGDKEKIGSIYMCPVVMSTTYGEREGKLNLAVAWEILGGLPCSGLCGYIKDTQILENNSEYKNIIEKKAENMYRTIHQKLASFPASNQAVNQTVAITKGTDLTPQESEQLSKYASDDGYVQRQKEDITQLASYFKEKLVKDEPDDQTEYVKNFESHFLPQPGVKVVYKFQIDNKKIPLVIRVQGKDLICSYEEENVVDVDISISSSVLNEIVHSRMTFQRAFMSGNMKMKGDFKMLRMLDNLFVFKRDMDS